MKTRGPAIFENRCRPRFCDPACCYLLRHSATDHYPHLSLPSPLPSVLSAFFSVLLLRMSSTAPFRVRVRLPTSKQETLTLTRPVTINSLLEGIQPFVNVDVTQIGIKIAYPSKVIDLGPPETWNRQVNEVGINSGESLAITILENGTANTTTTTTTQGNTSTAMTGTSVDGTATPVLKPSTPMQEPISVQPVKPRIVATLDNKFGTTTTAPAAPAEKRPSNLSPARKTGSPAKRSKGPSVQDEPPEVEIEGGTIVLRIMEDDNSCMYLPPNRPSFAYPS